LARYYEPYQGAQSAWETAPAGYVTKVSNITIYHGLPPRPYVILGRFSRPNLAPAKLAKAANYYHAEAVFLSESAVLSPNQVQLTPGNWGEPATGKPIRKTYGYAYLINFK